MRRTLAQATALAARSDRRRRPPHGRGRPPELVFEQIELVRRLGIRGHCLFAYGHLSDEQLQMLKTGPNTEPAAPYFR